MGFVYNLGRPFQFPEQIAQKQKSSPVPTLHAMVTVKSLAQSIQGIVLTILNLPKVLPTRALSAFQWVVILVPFEAALAGIKSMGNALEFPERLIQLRRVGSDWATNKWKAVYRVTSAFYIGLDAVVLVPMKYGLWNLLEIGGWAAKVGVTATHLAYVRDGLTAFSSAINFVAEGKSRDGKYKEIALNEKRIEKSGSLDTLKELLKSSTPDFDKIDQLKKEHASKAKKDKADAKTTAEKAVTTLTQKKDKLVQEKEKLVNPTQYQLASLTEEIQGLDKAISAVKEKLARVDVWTQKTTATNIDKLRQVIDFKFSKSEVKIANAKMAAELSTVTRYYDSTKCAVVILTNALKLGAAATIATTAGPLFAAIGLGLSVVSVERLLTLGQMATGFACGISGLGKCAAKLRFGDPFALPQTQLLKI